jgi:undecaprenyl-diphosphatase
MEHLTPVLQRSFRLEWPILFIVAAVAGATWGFIELADAIHEGEAEAFDRVILLAFRSGADPGQPLGPRWFEEMMRDFTALGGTGVLTLITLAVAGYLALTGKRRASVAVLLAVGGGILLSSLLKAGFDRPRPDLVPHGSYVYTTSFPSGHSMMAAVVYLTLAALIARVERMVRTKLYVLSLAVLFTFLIGISRIYLGVHWPTDVIGGWAMGAAWAMLCWLGTLWLQSRGKVEPEGD